MNQPAVKLERRVPRIRPCASSSLAAETKFPDADGEVEVEEEEEINRERARGERRLMGIRRKWKTYENKRRTKERKRKKDIKKQNENKTFYCTTSVGIYLYVHI